MKNNSLVIHDSRYELNSAYLAGAMAMRRRIPNNCNPHEHSTQKHLDWDAGHVNESACEHIRFGIDVISAKRNGRDFMMDVNIPHNVHGVCPQWYREQLNKLQTHS